MEEREMIGKFVPPKAIDSISMGFQIASKNLYLILFPLFVDLFLWLGPKLSIKNFILTSIQDVTDNWSGILTNSAQVDQFSTFTQGLSDLFGNPNYFSSAITFPVGVPSLIASNTTVTSPFNNSGVIELTNITQLSLIWLGLSLFGIILGTIFFRELATAASNHQNERPVQKNNNALRQLLNSLLFMVSLFLILSLTGFMLVFAAAIFSVFSPTIAQFILLLGMAVLVWLCLPLVFGAHGIFVSNQPFYLSIKSAYKVMGLSFRYPISKNEVLFAVPKSITFIFLVYILYQGLNLVWSIPGTSSWLLLVGIVGHAFIGTALLASSFHYYSALKLWLAGLWAKTET
ncbi:MAG: hypothetical protein HPY85_04290 [Anaerolineae bacterium]|nr:hypothetical protein [Anaerolineae bacterium]